MHLLKSLCKSKYTPEQEAKIKKVMEEFKAGTLKSSDGKTVTDRSQALAIAISEATRMAKSHVKEHTRISANGTVSIVHEHEDNRHESMIGSKWSSLQGEKTIVNIVKVGDGIRYAVQIDDSPRHELIRPEDIEKEKVLDARQVASRTAMQGKVEKEKTEAAQEQANRNHTHGFTDGLSAMAQEKIIEALNKQQGFNGEVVSRKKYIESAVESGAKVTMHNGARRLSLPSGSFFSERDITKTAMDYAAFLANNKMHKSLYRIIKTAFGRE